MTPAEVQDWLEAYVDAWRSYEPEQIGALFAADAEYRYRPYQDIVGGRDAIVASWLEDRDEPGSWEAEYHPVIVDGSHAFIAGETRYSNGHVYSNLWELEFDADARCSKFVEWYMQHP